MPAYDIRTGADFEDGDLVVDTGVAKYHGIALWPAPSDNPEDPLRWPRWLKIVAFMAAGLCNFSGNISGSGISVASQQLMMDFGKTENQVNSGIMAYNFLLLGAGNIFWVPVAVKFGKRPTLISSTCILFGSLIWCAKAQTFGSLVGGRCIAGFAASAGESIVPAIVPDIFFLHERGAMMSIYVILTAGGSAVGPLISGYMIEGTGSWRDFVWFTAALAGFNALCLIFAFPEPNFERPTPPQNTHENMESKTDVLHVEAQEKAADVEGLSTAPHGAETINVSNPSYTKMVTTVFKLNPEVNFFKTLLHPFIFLTYIPVVWAIFVYGVSLSPQIILIFKFPSLLTPPPYLFSTGEIGLMQVAALIGFVFACFGGGWVSDIITAKRIVKSGGAVYAEQRLLSLIPGMAIAPAGCILIAFAGSKKLSWPALAIGFGMLSFGTVYSPNIAITYVVDSYPRNAAESLVLINIVKNIVAFIFIYVAVDWIGSEGFLQVYMIMFMLACVALLLAVPLYFYGRQLRLAVSKSQRHKWFL